MRRTRAGVSCRPWRSGSSPIPARMVRTASSNRSGDVRSLIGPMLAADALNLARARWPRYRPRDDVLPMRDAINLRAAAVAAAAVGIGLAAAWIWPPLAVVTVWPLFLIVPGWAAVSWATRRRARISSTGRAGLAVVLSVAVSAHLVWWLASTAGGYGREVVFVAAAILALPSRSSRHGCTGRGGGRLPPPGRAVVRAVRNRLGIFSSRSPRSRSSSSCWPAACGASRPLAWKWAARTGATWASTCPLPSR